MATAPATPYSPRSRPAVTWGVFLSPDTNLGSWDGATNNPALTGGSGTRGDSYTAAADAAVSPAIDGISSVTAGDKVVFNGTAWVLNPVLRPALTDRVDWLKPTSINLVTDGHQFDTIHLEVITSRAGFRVQDLNVPMGYNRIVEVRQLDDAGEWSKVIGWGQLATQGQRLSRNDESLTAVARLDWFLFGGRLTGYRTYDQQATSYVAVEEDIVFNPMIDGQVEGNCSDAFDVESDGSSVSIFVSPETMRTQFAITLSGQAIEKWDLPKAILTLCWLLNPDETNITNPTLLDLQAVITDTNTRLMKNIRVPLGSSLPQALDLVCEPMGYHWFTETVVDDTDPTFPVTGTHLRFFKNGVGVVTDLKCQRVGETIRSDETNIADYSATLEIATPNVVYGRGSLKQREGTFECVPGWKATLDKTPLQKINSQTFLDTDSKDLRNVARFWVLNEAGDWGDDTYRPGVEDFTDLADLFEEAAVRLVRRKFLPMLTKTKSAADRALRGSGGIVVEWNDVNGDWQPYTGGWSVAQHQCGIILEGEIPADFWTEFLRKAAAVAAAVALSAHVRVTATIESDTRISYTADRRDEAPHGRDIPVHIDLDDRFHDRLVRLTGDYASRWDGNHFTINAVSNAVVGWIQVSGDLTDRIRADQTFVVRGSTGNDGRYTVDTMVVSGGNTKLFTKETVYDDAVDGKVGIDTEEAADLPAMTRFCVEARNVHDGAKVAVSASLKGHDWSEYKRGNIVRAVQPRGLDLNNYHNTATETRHPQVVGINYAFTDDSQRMELVLEVPEAERPELEKSR